MVTLLLLSTSASAVELGLGARNSFDDQLFVDAPQVAVREAIDHFAIEGYVAYGVSQAPSVMSHVLLDRSLLSGGGQGVVLDQNERLCVGVLGGWDIGSPAPPPSGLSGSPHLFAGAEVRTWEESSITLRNNGTPGTTDTSFRYGAGPVLGAGLNLRLDRLNLRMAMLDRTLIGARPTINPRLDGPVEWVHSPTITVDALWNLGSPR